MSSSTVSPILTDEQTQDEVINGSAKQIPIEAQAPVINGLFFSFSPMLPLTKTVLRTPVKRDNQENLFVR